MVHFRYLYFLLDDWPLQDYSLASLAGQEQQLVVSLPFLDEPLGFCGVHDVGGQVVEALILVERALGLGIDRRVVIPE